MLNWYLTNSSSARTILQICKNNPYSGGRGCYVGLLRLLVKANRHRCEGGDKDEQRIQRGHITSANHQVQIYCGRGFIVHSLLRIRLQSKEEKMTADRGYRSEKKCKRIMKCGTKFTTKPVWHESATDSYNPNGSNRHLLSCSVHCLAGACTL